MNFAYHKAIASARAVDVSHQNQIRCWAVVRPAGETSLVSLAYMDDGAVQAQVIWRGEDRQGAMELVADHLNEGAGAGRELVTALVNLYQSSAPQAGFLDRMVSAVSGAPH
ncbi:hypothetical protein [Pseudomonas putida]|uniref:hypothetical protein n=1 Tax=Pseudomonas putida TaxID=303 RepID=UPI00330D5BDB|nr:hypothetical protein [Pseudomonas putida]